LERDAPCGQEGGYGASPLLAEALAGLGSWAMQAIGEVIVLHREFPAWAVWLPQGAARGSRSARPQRGSLARTSR